MKQICKLMTLVSALFLVSGAIAQGTGGMAAAMGAGMTADAVAMGGGNTTGADGEPVNRCAPEFQGQIPNSLAAVDTSGNGTVEKEELAEHVAGNQVDNLFGRWDTDGNGALDEKEFCFRQ